MNYFNFDDGTCFPNPKGNSDAHNVIYKLSSGIELSERERYYARDSIQAYRYIILTLSQKDRNIICQKIKNADI